MHFIPVQLAFIYQHFWLILAQYRGVKLLCNRGLIAFFFLLDLGDIRNVTNNIPEQVNKIYLGFKGKELMT